MLTRASSAHRTFSAAKASRGNAAERASAASAATARGVHGADVSYHRVLRSETAGDRRDPRGSPAPVARCERDWRSSRRSEGFRLTPSPPSTPPPSDPLLRVLSCAGASPSSPPGGVGGQRQRRRGAFRERPRAPRVRGGREEARLDPEQIRGVAVFARPAVADDAAVGRAHRGRAGVHRHGHAVRGGVPGHEEQRAHDRGRGDVPGLPAKPARRHHVLRRPAVQLQPDVRGRRRERWAVRHGPAAHRAAVPAGLLRGGPALGDSVPRDGDGGPRRSSCSGCSGCSSCSESCARGAS